MRRRNVVFLSIALVLATLGGFVIYFSATHTSLLEILNFLNPPSEKPKTLAPEEELKLVPKELTVNGNKQTLSIPEGYKIEVFAEGFSKARFMALDPKTGDLYLTESDKGRVWNVTKRQIVAEGLDYPHGITFFEGTPYVSDKGSVYRFANWQKEVLIDNLPRGGNHISSTIAFSPEGKLYVSRGSSCNACEDDPRRAAVLWFDQDGKNEKLFASGLRNSVGLAIHPVTGELWGTDNGRDFLGNELPPEEVNIIKEGRHYGWPYCYGQNIPDPNLGSEELCEDKEPPVVEMQAHSAPLGMGFTEDGRYLFVAFHGSWNRTIPTGYKIVRIEVGPNGEDPKISDYITGWLVRGKAWGRPADVILDEQGTLYISDDFSGVIYKLSKE